MVAGMWCVVRSTYPALYKSFPPDMFIRTHRAFAASIYYIGSIDKDHLVIGGQPVPIAKRYYKSVIEQLNIIE